MKHINYFKITFTFIAIGLTTGLFLYNLITDALVNQTFSIGKTAILSLFTGITTGLTLGILNMHFKVLPFKKRDN